MSYYTDPRFISDPCDCRRIERERDDLRAELDHQRWREQQEKEQREREREQERRDRSAYAEAAMHVALSWPDAFHKASYLYGREEREEEADNAGVRAHIALHPQDAGNPAWQETSYFVGSVAVIERARQLYNTEMRAVEEEYERLQAAALARVADAMESEQCEHADTVIRALRNNDPNHLVCW
ncbi:MAG: hypothetical protein JO157_05925 [Acetobacteraceae bacterium]|nr:hypothetical protein [Acetobacteraceae bacterium]